MMVDAADMRVMQVLADATNVIAEGEVLQLMNMHDASLDEAAYLRVIRSKTAKLFEASARLAAVLAGSDAEIEEACADYGQALGTAFQVIDDVLDYDGDAQEMGKNLGDDLREGKATLPLIAAMQRGTATSSATMRNAIETGSTDNWMPSWPSSATPAPWRSTREPPPKPARHGCRRGNFQPMPTQKVCYNWRLSCLSAAPKRPQHNRGVA